MIVERLKFGANKGFIVGYKHLREVMAQVANDGRERTWTDCHPNSDSIRAFHAPNRDITFRNSENKEAVKLKGERFNHVEPFFSILEGVESKHPGILEEGRHICNTDETSVTVSFG